MDANVEGIQEIGQEHLQEFQGNATRGQGRRRNGRRQQWRVQEHPGRDRRGQGHPGRDQRGQGHLGRGQRHPARGEGPVGNQRAPEEVPERLEGNQVRPEVHEQPQAVQEGHDIGLGQGRRNRNYGNGFDRPNGRPGFHNHGRGLLGNYAPVNQNQHRYINPMEYQQDQFIYRNNPVQHEHMGRSNNYDDRGNNIPNRPFQNNTERFGRYERRPDNHHRNLQEQTSDERKNSVSIPSFNRNESNLNFSSHEGTNFPPTNQLTNCFENKNKYDSDMGASEGCLLSQNSKTKRPKPNQMNKIHRDQGSVVFITKLLKETPDDVINCLTSSGDRWDSFFCTSEGPSTEVTMLLVNLLGEKICTDIVSNASESAALVSKAITPVFIGRIQEACAKFGLASKNQNSENRNHDRDRFLRNLYTFLYFTLERLSTSAYSIRPIIQNVLKVFSQHTPDSPVSPEESLRKLETDFEELHDIIRSIIGDVNQPEDKKQMEEIASNEQKKSKFFFTPAEEEILHSRDPPEDFREIPIIPTINEILSPDESFLRPNKTSGAYKDAEHYLDVQFRLFREDFLRPLKIGIQEFMKNKQEYLVKKKRMPFGTVRLYQKIRITKVDLFRDTIVYTLHSQEEAFRRIKWDKSRRLLNGSLLLFTSDNLKSVFFGVVNRRDPEEMKNKGTFGITWEGNKPDISGKDNDFLMFESECYFEAYRHTLQVLKNINLEIFPMAKFIVGSSDDVGPPKYLTRTLDMMKIGGTYIPPLQSHNWPAAVDLKLDSTQFEAFHAALTKEFSIIQGPPGTGKTFLGLKVIYALLSNTHYWWQNNNEGRIGGPILIVCLTNHALDQFLEGVITILEQLEPGTQPELIRVGGRTKSTVLEKFSLASRRLAASRMHQHDRVYQMTKSRALRRVRELEADRADLMSEYLGLGNVEGLVDFVSLSVWPELRNAFPEELWNFLKDPNWFGLFNQPFLNANFNVDNVIYGMFKIRPKPIIETPTPVRQRAPIFEEDDEDYDLDELQENRIMDHIFYEAEFKDKGQEKNLNSKVLHYIREASLTSLSEIISTAELSGDKSKRIIIARNQKKFLEKFFKYVQDGLVELPQIQLFNLRSWLKQNVKFEVVWAIYFDVVNQARAFVRQALASAETNLIAEQTNFQQIQRQGDGKLLQQTKVVGMTTTGASKAADFLQSMKSKIVIVEEAAEVLEAHIINCITEHCEHLIMIGDHQQLRPNITVLELASKYHLNISLFERMVNNKLNCHKLLVQHRMRPEISNLVKGTIYNELEDHQSVLDFQQIQGLVENVFFVTHKHQESSDSDSVTKTNTHEAKFIVGLCNYLILQGYSTSKITILATYTGQMFLIKKELGNPILARCKGVRVTSVDNFQGEENDIILLSLVRSNQDSNVGFLKVDNRICVALSRARRGFYIVGNMNNLVHSGSKTWKLIQDKLIKEKQIGEAIPLRCQTHGTLSKIERPTDFARFPEGGCTLICGQILSCGHSCKSVCHPQGRDHFGKLCLSPCDKECPSGHKCKQKCYMSCKACPFKVPKTLPCNHIRKVECHVNVMNVICKEQMIKQLRCGDDVELPCNISIDEVQCKVQKVRILSCGHSKTHLCFQNPKLIECDELTVKILKCGHEVQNVICSASLADFQCKQIVTKRISACGHFQEVPCCVNPLEIKCDTLIEAPFKNCTHQIEIPCHNRNKIEKCVSPCSIRLDCGHQCRRTCHPNDDPRHHSYTCEKDCVRKCLNNHPCGTNHKCFQQCPPCNIMTTKFFPCHVHRVEVKCNATIADRVCRSDCEKSLPCNHKCENLCYLPCGPCMVIVSELSPCGHMQKVQCGKNATQTQCNEMVKSYSNYSNASCGHYTLVPCKLKLSITREESTKYCKHPCGFVFDEIAGGCNHTCKGSCSECLQGRIHKKCGEECGKSLVCGHVCTFPCSNACPPCQQNCNMRCDHSECRRKCGVPCIDCCEPCTWKCIHKRCTKLCRDPCDRDPCDEPCTKKLPCGHSCIGNCGEPCPPLCRICDKTALLEFILYGYEEDDDSRFVYLEDCKHCIEVQAMDHYMKTDIEVGGIVAKCCPRCRTLIRYSKRYGNILRSRLSDVMAVKRKVFGNNLQIQGKQQILITELTSTNSAWLKYLPNFRKFVLLLLVDIVQSTGLFSFVVKDKCVPKNLDQYTFGSIELISKHGQDAVEILASADRTLTKALAEDLARRYVELFAHLSKCTLPLSIMEISDFDREFQRLFDLKQLYFRKSSPQFTTGHVRASPFYDSALLRLTPSTVYTKYTEDCKLNVHRLLLEIDACLRTGIGISEREKREILSAIGMKQGHWYKCPNGHIYVITECGGATQKSKCNECGALIGGGSHRLLGDNALATEMDGAVLPAWPPNLQQ